jgi:TPR repeat protein
MLEHKCPFCREELPATQEEAKKIAMKRVEANDPVALFQVGCWCNEEGDYEKANKYFTKAAKLGNIESHFNLSILYAQGQGVEKDEEKEIYHLEEAATGGHPDARFNLGCIELRNGRFDRGVKHYVIAAKLGYDRAVKAVKNGFEDGIASKENYATALRGHQAAVDATKSKQREEAYAVDVLSIWGYM